MTVYNVVHVQGALNDPKGAVLQLNALKEQGDPEVLVMSRHGRFVGIIERYNDGIHAEHLTLAEVLTLPDAVKQLNGHDGSETRTFHADVEGTELLVTLLSSARSYDLQRQAIIAYLEANPLPAPGTEKIMSSEEVFRELGLGE